MPHIPGYLETASSPGSLGDLWDRPTSDFPTELWPTTVLEDIKRDPDAWVTVAKHGTDGDIRLGVRCVLAPATDEATVVKGSTWIGRDLGTAWGHPEESFFSGMEEIYGDSKLEFFAQVRHPSGATQGVVDISHPFLWFWDAFPVADGWNYVDQAGRDQQLIRFSLDSKKWEVQVSALEFRMFLASSHHVAVIQVDAMTWAAEEKFERVDEAFSEEWANFEFSAHVSSSLSGKQAVSLLMGQYVLSGLVTSKVPKYSDLKKDENYPDFIYAVDAATGRTQSHTCDPAQLGTYFDKDDSRLHYLSPVYFSRAVLQPYISDPLRYRVSASRLECLDLWALDIGFNDVGLVEVYLGDIGEYLPDGEWGHWRSYNVLPQGKMDEGRYRRDFLAQWASSADLPGDLRRARESVAHVSEQVLGKPIWRPLSGLLEAQFASMVGPLTESQSDLHSSVLILTKALVDSIDPSPLKSFANGEKNVQSLVLLDRYLQSLGDDGETIRIFRLIQNYRSRGGVAHLENSSSSKAAADLGIDGSTSLKAFESIVERLTNALASIERLIAPSGND